MKKLTPAQQQYVDIKKNYKDAILFFRMWDFYEVFYEDAKICAKILDIALTTRDRNSNNPVPMAWIPFHAVEKYLPKLLETNYKVAIAEQVGQVVPWKVVERKVTQVITPWTYVQEDRNENNILAIISNNGKYFLAYSDVSTWIFHIQEIDDLEELKDVLFKISPKEFVLPIDIENKEEIEQYISNFLNPFVTHLSIPYDYEEIIKLKTNVNKLDSFGQALDNKEKQQVLWMFFEYLEQLNLDFNILKIKFEEKQDNIYFDTLSIKNLEILQSSYDQNKKNSLLNLLDKTSTSSGSRLFRNWLLHPLRNLSILKYRQEWFSYFITNSELREKISPLLKNIYDIERLTYLILTKSNNPFHWLKLKISLNTIFEITQIDNKYISLSENLKNLLEILNKWLKDEWFTIEKDFIQDKFFQEVDELRDLAYHSDKLILDYQQELVSSLWVNVRVKYVNNQWFLIEISKKDVEKFESKFKLILDNPDILKQVQDNKLWEFSQDKYDFIRKQTLKIAERYISPYLKKLEEQSLTALYKLQDKEKEILDSWKQILSWLSTKIEELSQQVGQVDIFVNLWQFFSEYNYILPELNTNEIEIIWWRHPVIEKFLPINESFIENDLEFEDEVVHIITWPNMGGKSTYLRQNALILLLAHTGMYVPAKQCKTPLLSWIFARVGSGDVLVKNQSTFMTEMIEVANILNNADEKSFIIFDELWRGTSTYDGMAISQAVIEYIIKKLKAKTLFATHYHELIKLEEKYPKKVKNFSVAVYENNGNIVFMKKIVPGGASKSYWIHVGELAWLPQDIIENAKQHLENLENKKRIVSQNSLFSADSLDKEYEEKYNDLISKIKNIDINNITPLQALEILERLKKKM